MKILIILKKMPIFLFIIIFSIFAKIQTTPLSFCMKGRISPYTGWENGGSCGLGAHQNAISSNYIYPASPNEALFLNSAQCGVCLEMIGPNGAIKVRVEDYCPKNNKFCSGDMKHFNIANNGASYIMGNANIANITFRMVSCDYKENIKIKTASNVENYYLSFIVLNHNLAVSNVEIFQFQTNSWKNMTRNQNYWIYYNMDNSIKFPLEIKIYSINGDYVTVTINNLEKSQYYEANSNFIIPENTYFDVSDLKKVTQQIDSDFKKCCERDKSDFTPIYKDGYVNGGYTISNDDITIKYDSTDTYQGKYSLNAIFQKSANLTFKPSFPIRADQYNGISFNLKYSSISSNYLDIQLYDIENNPYKIFLTENNIWKNYSISFDRILDNKFKGIIFSYKSATNQILEINIENIELIPNPNAPDASICLSNETSSESNVPYDPNSIFIYGINIYENNTKVLNINCREFKKSEPIFLRLISKSGGNNVNITNCILPNTNIISSFSCTLPDIIDEGIYYIENQSTNELNFVYSKNIEIKNGLIVCGNINSYINNNTYYYPIIIIYSKEQKVNRGDKITFKIYSIPIEKFNLDNNEIILLNSNGNMTLHLKFCLPIIQNKNIISVECTVSRNIMKANYTTIYSNEMVYLLDSQAINFISSDINGGIISSSYSKVFSSNYINLEKRNFNLTFNVYYYNSDLKPGDAYPYIIYLYGFKKSKEQRNLDDKSCDSQIILENCILGKYSSIEPNVIDSIICKIPDYVEAGNYTKFQTEGIDTNPLYPINIVFENDFNRSESLEINKESKSNNSSSGKSNGWIIWIVVAIPLVILIGLIIAVLKSKMKGRKENRDKKENNSTIQNDASKTSIV